MIKQTNTGVVMGRNLNTHYIDYNHNDLPPESSYRYFFIFNKDMKKLHIKNPLLTSLSLDKVFNLLIEYSILLDEIKLEFCAFNQQYFENPNNPFFKYVELNNKLKLDLSNNFTLILNNLILTKFNSKCKSINISGNIIEGDDCDNHEITRFLNHKKTARNIINIMSALRIVRLGSNCPLKKLPVELVRFLLNFLI